MNRLNKISLFGIIVISLFCTLNVNAATQCKSSIAKSILSPSIYNVTSSIKKVDNSTFNYSFKIYVEPKTASLKSEITKVPFSYICSDAVFIEDSDDYKAGTPFDTGSFYLTKDGSKFSHDINFTASTKGNFMCVFSIPTNYVVDGCVQDVNDPFSFEHIIESNGTNTREQSNQCTYNGELSNVSSQIVEPINCNNTQTNEFEKEFCKAKNNALSNSKTDTVNGKKLYSTINGQFKGTLKFKCDPQKGIQGMIDGSINPNDYVNVSYAYGNSIESSETFKYVYHYNGPENPTVTQFNVEKKCEEAVTVEYGAPIASKAGLCFQYKVKVTSRVVCSASSVPPVPETRRGYCEPVPLCLHTQSNGKTVKLTQGGPNDAFDECIEKCDGGKYTTKCSQSCYKQVYGDSSSSTKTSFNFDSINASKLAYQTCLPSKAEKCDNCKLGYSRNYYLKYPVYEGENAADYCSDNALKYDTFKNAPENKCYFYKKNKKIYWKCSDVKSGSTDISQYIYGRWYAYSENANWGLTGKIEDQCYYSVKKDDNGIPRRDHSNGNRCHDSCSWTVDYDSCNGNKYLNPGWSEVDNKENIDTYNKAVAIVNSSSTCTTSQATFTISASYYDKTDKKDVTIYFPYDHQKDYLKSGVDMSNTTTNKNTTIIDYNGCYKVEENRKDANRHWYQSEWSFPGSYLDSKHNKLSYDYNSAKVGWETIKAFCLPLNAGDVNRSWYNWFMRLVIKDKETSVDSKDYKEICLSKDDSKSISKITKFTDEKDLVWNIVADTKLFGYYKWNINISCFYAINSKTSTGSINDNNTNADDKCVVDSEGYSIRSVDLKNLFPNSKGAALSDSESTGRTPGFNWSEYANNAINNSSYTSKPKDYATTVQSLGYSVYDEKYLDYEFELDKSDLNKLKNHKYTSFDGESVKRSNGITSYYSSYLREFTDKIPNKSLATTCNNLKNYNASSCQN